MMIIMTMTTDLTEKVGYVTLCILSATIFPDLALRFFQLSS
jgi:hypothetical protein